MHLANILLKYGLEEYAVQHFKNVITLYPDSFIVNFGMMMMVKRQEIDAGPMREKLQKTLEKDPSNLKALTHLGILKFFDC